MRTRPGGRPPPVPLPRPPGGSAGPLEIGSPSLPPLLTVVFLLAFQVAGPCAREGRGQDEARILRITHDPERGITTIDVNAAPLPPYARINIFRSHAPITEENLLFCPRVASLAGAGTICSIKVADSGEAYYALTPSDPYKRQDRAWLKKTLVGPFAEVCKAPPLPPSPVRYCMNGRAFLRWPCDGRPTITRYQVYQRQADGRQRVGTLPSPDVSGEISFEIPFALAEGRDYLFSVTAVNSSGLESAESAPVSMALAPDLELAKGETIARNADFSISKMFPVMGKSVKLSVTVHNRGLTAARAVGVSVSAFHDRSNTSRTLLERQVDLSPDQSSVLEFEWTPEIPGEYRLKAVVDPSNRVPEIDKGNNQSSVLVPVVRRDIYIAWYGNPLEADWCNLPNARQRDIREWKRRGAIAGFCGMTGNIEESYRRQIKAGFNGVSVDEIGGYDEGTASFIKWLTGLKNDFPDFFIALWMAASPSRELAANGRIDLYLGENYYRIDTPLASFDGHIRRAREMGISGKYLFGISANIEEACTFGHTHTVNEQMAYLEKQMIYVAENAPEMPGIAIYGSRPGLSRKIDQLCYEHFVRSQFKEE